MKILLSYAIYRMTGIKTPTAKRELEKARIRKIERERASRELQAALDAEHRRRFGWDSNTYMTNIYA